MLRKIRQVWYQWRNFGVEEYADLIRKTDDLKRTELAARQMEAEMGELRRTLVGAVSKLDVQMDIHMQEAIRKITIDLNRKSTERGVLEATQREALSARQHARLCARER